MTLLSIPGVVKYSRPNQLGLSNGAAVVTDTDFSVGGTFSGTVPAAGVTYDAATGMFLLDGVTGRLETDSLAARIFDGTNMPFTFMGLVQVASVPAIGSHANFWIVANVSGGTTNSTRDFYCAPEAGEYVHSDGRNDSASLEFTCGAVLTNTDFHAVGCKSDGATISLWIDGVCVCKQRSDIGDLILNVFGGFTEGCHRREDGNNAFLKGRLGERAYWDTCRSDAEMVSGMAYLATLLPTAAVAPAWEPANLLLPLTEWRDDTLVASGSWTDGGNVTAWAPRGFQNYPITLADPQGGSWPKFSAVQQGGRPMVQFAAGVVLFPQSLVKAGSQFLQAGTPAFTLFGAIRPAGIGVEQDWFSLVNASNGAAYFRVGINAAGAYQVVQRNNAGLVTAVSGGVADTNFHIWDLVFDGSHVTLTIDGVNVISNAALSGGASNIAWCIPAGGAYIDSAQVHEWRGCIGHIGMFTNDVVAPAGLAKIRTYLNNWWGRLAAVSTINNIVVSRRLVR